MQRAIEVHFEAAGFVVGELKHADFYCVHPETGDAWHIEAKGLTTQVGLDFRTGVGQLVQRMRHEEAKHGLAMPDIAQFRREVAQFAPWVIAQLKLHWVFVDPEGRIKIVTPGE